MRHFKTERMKRGEKKDKTRFLFWVMILLCMWDATRFFTLFVLSLARQKYPNAHTANSKYSLLQSQCNNSFIFFFTFFYVNTAHPIVVSSVFFFFSLFYLIFLTTFLLLLILRVFPLFNRVLCFVFFFYIMKAEATNDCISPQAKELSREMDVCHFGLYQMTYLFGKLKDSLSERHSLSLNFWNSLHLFRACGEQHLDSLVFFFFRFNQKLCTTLLR